MTQAEQLEAWIQDCSRIVFFGGAGVSTESGIPDFRSVDGLYHQKYKFPPETILSHSFFEHHTKDFFDFYKDKMLCLTAKPNPAHLRLAQLEQQGRLAAIVTQNIDGLHQAAGSKRVLELHGSVHRNFCMDCGKSYDAAFILNAEGIPRCSCGGIIKPDVVLYGESLDSQTLEDSIGVLSRADMVIVGGTSLAVYPAAGLLDYYGGQKLVLLNKTPTPLDRRANLIIQGSIGEILGAGAAP